MIADIYQHLFECNQRFPSLEWFPGSGKADIKAVAITCKVPGLEEPVLLLCDGADYKWRHQYNGYSSKGGAKFYSAVEAASDVLLFGPVRVHLVELHNKVKAAIDDLTIKAPEDK